jgi:hypothetical protein
MIYSSLESSIELVEARVLGLTSLDKDIDSFPLVGIIEN